MPTTTTRINPAGVNTISDDILREFTKPGHPLFSKFRAVGNYRGNGTETEARSLKKAMGGSAYEHFNYDTLITNGQVIIRLPRFRHPLAEDSVSLFSIPAEWYWAWNQVEDDEDVRTASPMEIETAKVPAAAHDLIRLLPNWQWMHIQQINFFEHGAGRPKARHRPAPKGVLFFKFDGGQGAAVACGNS